MARELAFVAAPAGWTVVFRGRREFDLTYGAGLARLLDQTGPACVINAAAYTAVEQAEDDVDTAFALNRDAAEDLAKACAARGLPLVHFSTDYVFDGTKSEPYVEDDARHPLNVYGRSKAEGEDVIIASDCVHAILRTSWVYAATGSNFVRTMLRLAAERDEVSVVDDQIGRPTWARDCAQAALLAAVRMSDGQSLGVLHLAGAGDASWADLAQAVFDSEAAQGRRVPRLIRVVAADFPSRVKRPMNSRLNTDRIAAVLGWQARPWRDSLKACLAQLEPVS